MTQEMKLFITIKKKYFKKNYELIKEENLK